MCGLGQKSAMFKWLKMAFSVLLLFEAKFALLCFTSVMTLTVWNTQKPLDK